MTRHTLFEYRNIDPSNRQHEYNNQIKWWRVDDCEKPDVLTPKAFATASDAVVNLLLLWQDVDGAMGEQVSEARQALTDLIVMMARERGIESDADHWDLVLGDLDVLPEVEAREPDGDNGHKIDEVLE